MYISTLFDWFVWFGGVFLKKKCVFRCCGKLLFVSEFEGSLLKYGCGRLNVCYFNNFKGMTLHAFYFVKANYPV